MMANDQHGTGPADAGPIGKARRESEARFREVLKNAPVTIYTCDRELRYSWIGSPIPDLAAEQILGRTDEDLFPAEAVAELVALKREVLATEQGQRREIALSLDGAVWFYDVTAEPLRDADGTLLGLTVAAVDVTERKRAEQTLQTHALLLESMVEGVSLSDEKGVIRYTNPAEDRMFGYARGELVGQHVTVQNAYPPAENARIVAEVIEELKAKGSWQGEWLNRRKDGTRFVTSAHITALMMDGRRHWLCVHEDITERKRAEDALRESEERHRWLVENTTEAVWRIEFEPPIPVDAPEDEQIDRIYRDRRLAECNEGMARTYGFASAAEMMSLRLDDLMPRAAAGNREYLRAFIRSGYRLLDAESEDVTKDGQTRYVMNNLVGVVEQGCLVRAWGTSRDVTERKLAEQALRRLNETLEQSVAERTRELSEANRKLTAEVAERTRAEAQLRHSQKMEAIGQLTGGVAHDFNNILTAIINNLELVRMRRMGEAEERQLDGALQAARNGAALVQQMLAFARKQPLQPRRIHLGELVSSMSALIARSCPENVALRTETATDLKRVTVDPGQMQTALLNLVVNARDAMPEGGSLTITATNMTKNATTNAVRADAELDQLPPGAPGDYVCLAVSDTGTGMPPEVLAQVFEPFFTTKGIGKGTGLGLSMVYGFIKQMGGDVVAESAVGRGTTVRLYLPATDAAAELLPAALQPAVASSGEAIARSGADEPVSILFVEDDFLVSLSTVQTLESFGYRTYEAPNAGKALEILDRRPEINLMVTDIGLPGMNGHELAAEARRRRPDLKILFVTGYDRTAMTERIAPDHATDYLGKPYQPQDLGNAVKRLLGAS